MNKPTFKVHSAMARRIRVLALILGALSASYFVIPASIKLLLEQRVQAANFVVTNTSDDANGPSLRGAILDALVSPGADTITFNIPANDPRHFYYVNDGVAGTVSRSMIAVTAASDDSTIADIDLDWPHSWYSIESAGFTGSSIEENDITIDGFSQPGSVANTNASGSLNSILKIEVTNSATDHSCSRMFLTFFAVVEIRGLVINGCGVSSGAKLIDFEIASDASVAAGNYLGTDVSGTVALGSGYGVHITRSSNVRVGGPDAADRNLISGNFRGIDANNGGISGFSFSNIVIEGNLIGTRRDGVSPLPNGFHPEQPTQRQDGVMIWAVNGTADSNRIEKNTIAHNARWGVTLSTGGVGAGTSIDRSPIIGNSIHSNGNTGINLDGNDLGPANAVTPNDACDADVGLNGLQNYPIISASTISGNSITMDGTLNSIANKTYRVEFFASTAADPTGFGEGQTYLGFANVVIPAGSCDGLFSISLFYPPGSGSFITTTATDPDGSTSEFSAAFHSQTQNCGVFNGDLVIVNTGDAVIDLSCVTGVTGSVTITGNTAATTISMANLGSIAGSVEISGNTAAQAISMGALTTAGNVTIEDNTSATTIDLGVLETAGAISMGGNTSAAEIDLGSGLSAAEIEITDNGAAEITIDLDLSAGDVTIESSGDETFSMGDGSTAGSIDLDLSGYNNVNGATAGGETSIDNTTSEALMSVVLPTGAFTSPVSFSITHLDPASLDPETGTGPGGGPVMIDPIAAYTFNFTVPTLNQNATLTFEIILDGLDTESRNLLLEGLASGRSTLATRSDSPGAVLQAFPVCPTGTDPTAEGCVRVEMLDANGDPTTGTPVRIRFTGVTGHFSTWAVAVMALPTAAPASISGRVMDQYGRGLKGVSVLITSSDGTSRSTITNSFGRYKLSELAAGETYILQAMSRRYQFVDSTRVISLSADQTEDFVAADRFLVVNLPTLFRLGRR